jgi:uncharacterized SAM-binding protein YcdF (DUF218 family)
MISRGRAGGLAGLLLTAAGLWLGWSALMAALGAFLVVEDPLEPAAAILVLSGSSPYREMEGARLFHEGWAPRVLLVQHGRNDEEYSAWRALGIEIRSDFELRPTALDRLGVPAGAVTVVEGTADATLDELEYALAALPDGPEPLIMVTSPFHTRRARMTAGYLGRRRVITRAAWQDPFPLGAWWREQGAILTVAREYMGLVNYALGFPVARRAG